MWRRSLKNVTGGYDPRLEDNTTTLEILVDLTKRLSLTYHMCTPSSSKVTLPTFDASATPTPDVVFLLNFATPQRSALLASPHTRALLYTPANEHFGIVPIEAMISGLPVLAADSGGPTESVVDPDFPGVEPGAMRTGWLRTPEPEGWATALEEIVALSAADRTALGARAKRRAETLFGMEAMARQMEDAIRTAVAMGPVGGFSWRFALALLMALVFLFVGSRSVA
jgi:alpha-1,3/alpha-1,6-mannosyltransferase